MHLLKRGSGGCFHLGNITFNIYIYIIYIVLFYGILNSWENLVFFFSKMEQEKAVVADDALRKDKGKMEG